MYKKITLNLIQRVSKTLVFSLLFITLSSFSSFAQVDANTVALWKMNEVGGTTVSDISGKGLNGSFVGNVSFASSSAFSGAGNALNFTGGYVNVPDNAAINSMRDAMTIEAWIYQSPNSNETIVDRANYNFLFQSRAYNKDLGFYNSATGWRFTPTTGAIPFNTWTHVAMTWSWNSSNQGTLKFFINGENVSTFTGMPRLNFNDGPLNIGRQDPNGCKCNNMNGLIDELRLSNVVRTQQEIQAMSTGSPGGGDTTKPVITLSGVTTVTIEVGDAYLDLGATATDTYDDNAVLTSNIITVSDVDTSVVGNYTVKYNVMDAAGNPADEVTRTVKVVDTTLPIITITGETPQVIQAGSLYLDLGATATDTYDNNGVLTSNIAVISDVDTSVLGIYSVRYNVTDSNLNVADEVTRTVEVIDTTLPVLTLLGETPQIVEIGKLYLESGAQAEDNLDGDVTAAIVIDATNVDTAIPSSYIVTYNVTDANTNVAQELQRTVLVLSNRPTAVDDAISSPIAYNSKDNLVNVLANDSFGFDGAIDKGLTMVNGTSSNASSNGGAIRVERNNTLDTMDDVILYSSPEDFSGVDTFKYTITDATGHASTAIATVTVSDQRTDIPTAVKDAFPVISDTETLLDVLANDNFGTDGAGSLSLSGITISTAGFVLSIDPGATIAVSDDTVKYAPTGGFTGTDSFTYTLIDANGDIATATVKLTVRSAKPVNGKPIAVDDVLIEALVYNSIENSIAVLSNDNFGTDGPNATHSLRLLKGRRSSISANKGVITLADDVILYSAPKDFIGADTFQYVITDASGDASTGSVTLTVAGEVIIPGPVADFVSVDQNSVDNLIDVVANDNLGENGFGRMLIMSPFHLTAPTTEGGVINLFDNGTPADATDDKILYTPPTGFIGTDTFAYYLEVDGVEYTNGSVTITINLVAPVNGTPTAVDDDVTAPLVYNSKDNEIDVLANDDFGSDGAIDKGLTMVNGTSSNASANGGEIRVERKNTLDTMDDVILYSAPKDFSGVDTFKYTITDLSGEASTATATITVLEQVTDVPIAENDAIAVILDTETLLNVLANDNFGTDGAGSLGLNGVTTSAAGFAISINAGATPNVSDDRVSYTPTGGFIGTDSFSYIITDANGDIATAEVILTVVTPENTEPTANNDDETVAVNSVDNILNVTLNDDYGAEGENATHALRLRNGKSSTESTKGGKISVDNGNILYTPPTAFDGVDSFIYIITDASGDASWATVTVSVVIPKTETIDQGDDVTIENKFLVYPNPSNGYVKTMVYSTVKTSATILLFDVTGKVIYSAVKELATGKNEVDFNVNVKPGVLFLRVVSKEVNFGTSKIVFK